MSTPLKFVRRQKGISTKTNRPYDFIILSNGLTAGNASVHQNADIPDGLQEGDDVFVEFEVTMRGDRFDATVTSIERA